MAPSKRNTKDGYYLAQGILSERIVNEQLQYKIAWGGRDPDGQPWVPSWEPSGHATSKLRDDWEAAKLQLASMQLYTGVSDAFLLILQGNRSANDHEVESQMRLEQDRARDEHTMAVSRMREEERAADNQRQANAEDEVRCLVCFESGDDAEVLLVLPCCRKCSLLPLVLFHC
ncbi:hypothetical protein BKA63DRAFT_573049 [Paraphoma chrysanthemicola]|nr:hypothetical protein BKA63DRAFT_573049 [Paraphoma chrysanthemicola]